MIRAENYLPKGFSEDPEDFLVRSTLVLRQSENPNKTVAAFDIEVPSIIDNMELPQYTFNLPGKKYKTIPIFQK